MTLPRDAGSRVRWPMLVVPLVLLGLGLTSGCMVLGIESEQSSDSTTAADAGAGAPTSAGPSAQPDFMSELIDDYRARNIRAIEASRRSDPSLWSTVDTAGMLDRDLFIARNNELADEIGFVPEVGDWARERSRLIAKRQLTAPGESYPRWVLAHLGSATDDPLPSASLTTAAPPDSYPDAPFGVFVQSGPGRPWLGAVSGRTWTVVLPRGPIGAVAVGEDLERATEAAVWVRDWLGGPDEVPLDDELVTGYREYIASTADGKALGELSCSAYRPAVHGVPGAPAVDNGVYAARVGDTLLVAASYHCIRRFPNHTLFWNPPLDQVMGSKQMKPHPVVVHILFTRADDGTVRLIGAGGGMVLPAGVDPGVDHPTTSEAATSPPVETRVSSAPR